MCSRAFLLFPIMVAGCQNPSPALVAQSAFIPNGYACSATPSTAYSPGYVYRVDERGAQLLVSDSRNAAVTYNYRAALGTFDASAVSSGGLTFSLGQQGTTIDSNDTITSSQTSKISFNDGSFALMTDADEQRLIEKLREQINPRSGSRYFMVRDAIQAKGINIALSSLDASEFGGEISIGSLFNASPNVKVDSSDKINVSATFEDPVNVCIRAVEIESFATTADGEPSAVVEIVGSSIQYVSPKSLFEILDSAR